jgi:hypothetical protein
VSDEDIKNGCLSVRNNRIGKLILAYRLQSYNLRSRYGKSFAVNGLRGIDDFGERHRLTLPVVVNCTVQGRLERVRRQFRFVSARRCRPP